MTNACFSQTTVLYLTGIDSMYGLQDVEETFDFRFQFPFLNGKDHRREKKRKKRMINQRGGFLVPLLSVAIPFITSLISRHH